MQTRSATRWKGKQRARTGKFAGVRTIWKKRTRAPVKYVGTRRYSRSYPAPYKRRRLNPTGVKFRDTRGRGTFDSGSCSLSYTQRRYPRINMRMVGTIIRSDVWTVKKTGTTPTSLGWTRIKVIADCASLGALENSLNTNTIRSDQRKYFLKHSQTHFEMVNCADIPCKVTMYFFVNRNDTDGYLSTAAVNPSSDPYTWLVQSTKDHSIAGAVTGDENLFGWDLSMAGPQFKQKFKTLKICNMYIPACQTRTVNCFIKHNKIVPSQFAPDQVGVRYTTVHIMCRARTTQGRDNSGNDITFEDARINFMGYTKYHYKSMEVRTTYHNLVNFTGAPGALAAFPDPQDESTGAAPMSMLQ